MIPTQALDKTMPVKGVRTRPAGHIKPSGSTPPAQAQAESAPATIAQSVGDTRRLMETAKSVLKRADQDEINKLRQAVAQGSFRVDLGKLAGRMVEDASGGSSS